MAKKFEYKKIKEEDLNYGIYGMNDKFVQLGQEGWELVGTTSNNSGPNILYFKREIESPITSKQERSGYDMSR